MDIEFPDERVIQDAYTKARVTRTAEGWRIVFPLGSPHHMDPGWTVGYADVQALHDVLGAILERQEPQPRGDTFGAEDVFPGVRATRPKPKAEAPETTSPPRTCGPQYNPHSGRTDSWCPLPYGHAQPHSLSPMTFCAEDVICGLPAGHDGPHDHENLIEPEPAPEADTAVAFADRVCGIQFQPGPGHPVYRCTLPWGHDGPHYQA